jgi:DNA-binding NtrC family response regulator
LLDVLMPGMSGLQVIEDIDENDSAKVILMSAYVGTSSTEKSHPKICDFLEKPFDDIFFCCPKSGGYR